MADFSPHQSLFLTILYLQQTILKLNMIYPFQMKLILFRQHWAGNIICSAIITRSNRSRWPPIWTKDYICSAINLVTFVQDSLTNNPSQKAINTLSLNSSHWKIFTQTPEVHCFDISIKEPNSTMRQFNIKRWKDAMMEEIWALELNITWKVVSLPSNKIHIGCKWVCKVKYRSDDSFEMFEARLVGKGYNQKEGTAYQYTFSIVAKLVTIRTILTLFATK